MNSSQLVLMLQKESPLFNRVKSSILAAHLGSATRTKLSAGQVLLTPGQHNDRVYIVLSGRLRAQLNLDDSMKPLALFGLGECVGEMSMFDDNIVSAFIVAITDCELLSIAHADAWAILSESLQASHNMMNILAERMRFSNRLLATSMENAPGYEALDYINTVTGIYNRKWLADNLPRLINRNTITKQTSVFIMLQAANFEQYGAQFGELGRDQAMRTIAQTMLRCLRPNDIAVHLGDGQFAAYLPNTALEHVGSVINRLRGEIAETSIVTANGDALPPLHLSFGSDLIAAHDTLDGLIARAQDVMHQV